MQINPLTPSQLHGISTAALAHVGDAVYELIMRTKLCLTAPTAKKLHEQTTKLVCAAAQAKAAKEIQPHLTEEESAVFTRGRNAKTHAPPKTSNHADYALATALEALFGWLYLKGETMRLHELSELCFQH